MGVRKKSIKGRSEKVVRDSSNSSDIADIFRLKRPTFGFMHKFDGSLVSNCHKLNSDKYM